MGKASRTKGAAYERNLAARFRAIGFPDAKRHLEYQNDEAEEGRDLDGTQPFAIQAKCWKSAPPITSIEQIQPNNKYPIRVAILKRSSIGKTPLEVAVLDLDVFLRILEVLMEYMQFHDDGGDNLDWIVHGQEVRNQ